MKTIVRKMKRSGYQAALLLLPLLYSVSGYAQTGSIQGRVVDEFNEPLAGASVRIKELNRQAGTNDQGVYSFSNLSNGTYTIAVSYVGYEGTEQVATVSEGEQTVNFTLRADGESLDEVVVIGYGTTRKQDVTGSVASLQTKDFNKGVVVAPDQLMQGRAAGVMVINNTGQPGGSTTVRIRGNSSIRAGNNPLFVVDGIPLSGTSARPGGPGGYGSDGGNPLDYINPNDIASMDILKDASATAIYGSRGANGVVLITTKRGQSGSPSLNVMASTGVSNLLKKPEVLSADEFRRAIQYYTPNDESDHGGNVYAFDAITRSAISQNYSMDVSGGNQDGRYRISAGYLDQDGIIENSALKKYTANLSSNFRFLESKRLGLDFNIVAAQTRADIAPINVGVGFEGNIISQALQWNPTLPLRDNNGELTFQTPTLINPLTSLAAYKDNEVMNTILASIAPSYKITDDLEYKLMYSLTHQAGRRTGRFIAGMINPSNINNGSAFIRNGAETSHQLTHTLSYNKQLNTSLHLNALVGYEYLNYDRRFNEASGSGFSHMDDDIDYFDYLQYTIANNRVISSSRTPTNELQSFFARATLNYLDRYLFTGTVRRDGSTKFGINNKYANFPAFAFAWNIHNESFMEDSEAFSNLKLRLGWGKTGNQEFPSGASKDRYVFSAQSIVQANYGNPDLRWESSTTINAGIDFGFFRNRLTGSVDYFRKVTTDALFERTLAQPAPSGRIWVNLDGEIINEGVEVVLQGNIMASENWNWNLGVNATFLENSVTGLPGFYETAVLRGQGFSGVVGQRMVSGQPLNVWYLAQFEGIDPSSGMSMYRGLDGMIGTQVDPAQNKFYVNSPNPRQLLGISTDISYKRLTAAINMHGAFGHYLFNNTAATVLGVANLSNRNIGKNFFNPDAGESTSNSAAPSTRYLEKGDFLKLSNMTISYNVGNVGTSIRNLNISLTGQNLLVFTGYTGFDPEVNTDGASNGVPSLGIEYLPYPPARTFLLGLNFSL